MAGEPASTAEDRALDALTRILDASISPDMLEAQRLILRRLALAGDLFPSRIPSPLNITQIGGYLNLIEHDPVLRAQVLSSALGVAGPNPMPGWEPVLPALYFTTRQNDRPPEVAAATPVTIRIRSDFAGDLDAALKTIHDRGCVLPILAAMRPLPPAVPGGSPPADVLPYLGRTLELVPSAALAVPATDLLAVGQAGGAGPQLTVARQVNAAAPDAASVVAANWSLWTCTSTTCTQGAINDKFLELGPILNGAGWYQVSPLPAPTSASVAGGWDRWTNTTSLVSGVTTVGAELTLLYPSGAISASSIREQLDWAWDGSAFVAPA